MATPEQVIRESENRPELKLIVGNETPTVRSLFIQFATTHPSMPPLRELNIGQLYGGVLEPTETTRLRAVLGSLQDTYPPTQNINAARTVLDFNHFLRRTYVSRGIQIKFSNHIEDPTIPQEFLATNADQPRYGAVAKAMVRIIELDYGRDRSSELLIGADNLLRLGHLALFAVGQEEYTEGYRAISKNRALPE